MTSISLRSFLTLLSITRKHCILTLPMGLSSQDLCSQLAHLSPMDDETHTQLLHLKQDRTKAFVRINDRTSIDDLSTRTRFDNQYAVPGALALAHDGVLSIHHIHRFQYGSKVAELMANRSELIATGRYYYCRPMIIGDMSEAHDEKPACVARRISFFGDGFFSYFMKVDPVMDLRLNVNDLDDVGNEIDQLSNLYNFNTISMAESLKLIGVDDGVARAIEAANSQKTLTLGSANAA